MAQGPGARKLFGSAALVSHVAALIVGTIVILTLSLDLPKLYGIVVAMVVFTLFGFFSAMTVRNFPLLSLVGMVASVVALVLTVLVIVAPRSFSGEVFERLTNLFVLTSVGVGYINLLQSIKRKDELNLNTIIDVASVSSAVIVLFGIINLLGVELTSGFILKLLSLCVLVSTIGGLAIFVLSRINQEEEER